jgi:hypothetical protein
MTRVLPTRYLRFQALRGQAAVAAILAVATALPLADLWFCVAPPWPDHYWVLVGTMPIPLLVFWVVRLVFQGRSRPQLEGLLRRVSLAGALIAVAYIVAFTLLVYDLPDRWHRDVGGWGSSAAAELIRQDAPDISVHELFHLFDNQMTLVFDPTSVRLARALMLVLWYGLASAASLLLALLLRLRGRAWTDLDARIYALVPAVDENIRRELQTLAGILHQFDYPEGVLDLMMRPGMALMTKLYALHGEPRPSDNLFSCLRDAQKRHFMDEENVSKLDEIRFLSNKSHHGVQKRRHISKAESALYDFLSVLEWFYCECPDNPQRLASISSSES